MAAMEEKYQEQLDAVQNVIDFASQLLSEKIADGEIRAENEYNLPLCLIYVRSLKTAQALHLCCREGYGEDASILLRTLIESLINFFYITAAPEKNGALYNRFALATRLEQHKRLRDHAPSARISEFDWILDETKTMEALKEYNEKLKQMDTHFDAKHQETCDKRGWWSGKAPRQMAEELGKEFLWQYDFSHWLFSGFVHSNPTTYSSVAKQQVDRIVLSNRPDGKYVLEALLGCGEYLVNWIIRANDFFSTGKDDAIKGVIDRFYKAAGLDPKSIILGFAQRRDV